MPVPRSAPGAPATTADSGAGAAAGDAGRVAELLGREPRGRYEVVVRDAAGEPLVIRNAPLLDDGTPMPTRYWLVERRRNRLVGSLESDGGVRRAEAEVDPVALAAAHDRYAAERDAALPAGWDGARPSGGVGGTRRGVKCLHAHYAWFLAGGDDPVGAWVHERLGLRGPNAGAGLRGADARPEGTGPGAVAPEPTAAPS
jgi:hypothetical protein